MPTTIETTNHPDSSPAGVPPPGQIRGLGSGKRPPHDEGVMADGTLSASPSGTEGLGRQSAEFESSILQMASFPFDFPTPYICKSYLGDVSECAS